jgi:hypothetical protein
LSAAGAVAGWSFGDGAAVGWTAASGDATAGSTGLAPEAASCEGSGETLAGESLVVMEKSEIREIR